MYYFSLKIQISSDSQIDAIDQALGIASMSTYGEWEYEIEKNENHSREVFLYFLSILEANGEKLKSLNIESSDISFWILYEYQNQCNMEFSSSLLTEIGKSGITLCISCWEEGSNMTFDLSS